MKTAGVYELLGQPSYVSKKKKKRSDSVLRQKHRHSQKNPKSNVTTQNTTTNFGNILSKMNYG